MTETLEQDPIKAAARAVWASGDYAAVAREVIEELGPTIVAAAGVAAGEKVLDIAAGSGNAAIPAALAGADVVASDLTPELLDAGRLEAERRGVALTWEVGDAEALSYDDGTFDVALSCVGVMFAPFHERAAGELTRVVRPGGRIALISWTPTGFIGQMFATMKPYAAPPPAGVQPPPLWGDPDHVARLLGDRVRDLRAERRVLLVDRFGTAADFVAFFKRTYGPTIGIYRRLEAAGDPTAVAELDRALTALAEGYFRAGEGLMEWEYLLVTATVG